MIEKWMECFSGAKDSSNTVIEDHAATMALSYMQKAQWTADLLASPPLNNSTANPVLMNNMSALTSLLSPRQLMAVHLMSVGLGGPILPQTAANNPAALYLHQQNPFWTPPAASSPPSPLHQQQQHHHLVNNAQDSSITPKSVGNVGGAQRGRPSINNNNVINNNNHNHNNNNNNNISTTGKSLKRKHPSSQIQAEGNLSSPASPRNSSPESGSTARGSANKEKVFQCQVCLKTFGYKHVLQNHERTHTGEKPYECNVCHKRFTRDHHLKTHYRLHTGDKPYNCKTCDRTFVQVANLRRHMRVHTGERPYTCSYPGCAERFKDSNQLKNHLMKHDCKVEPQEQQPQPSPASSERNQSPPPPTMIMPAYHQQRLQSLSPAMSSCTADEDLLLETKPVITTNRRTHQPPVRLTMQIPKHEPQMMSLDLSTTFKFNSPVIPEQTEPEDLSVASVVKKRRSDQDSSSNCSSPLSFNDDRDYS